MASYRDIIGYFRGYGTIAIVSIAASSLFEVVDLTVPYAIDLHSVVGEASPLEKRSAVAYDFAGKIEFERLSFGYDPDRLCMISI